MVLFIIVLLIVGFIVGAIARLLMPGRDPIGVFGTIVLGIAGSFVGGFLQNLVENHTLTSTASTPSASSARSSAPGCCCSCSASPAWKAAAAAATDGEHLAEAAREQVGVTRPARGQVTAVFHGERRGVIGRGATRG